jgi:hypothetical protein
MNKSLIAPLVAVLALIVGAVFHISIEQDTQVQIVEVIGGIVSVVVVIKGIITNHKKETP